MLYSPANKPLPGSLVDYTHPFARDRSLHILFNERAGGIVRDLSIGMNPGTWYGTGSHWVGETGQFTAANNDYIRCGATNLGFDRTLTTLALWVKPVSITVDQYVTAGVKQVNTPNQRCIILGYQNGYFNIFNNGVYPTGTAAHTQIAASAGEWQNIIYCSDGSTLRGYKDGLLVVDVSANLTISSDMCYYYFGQSTVGSYFSGNMSEFAVYNRMLSDAEVKKLCDDRMEYKYAEFTKLDVSYFYLPVSAAYRQRIITMF